MADPIAENFDENGNALKAELLNEILEQNGTTETVTTVTIETTVTKVTSSLEESIVTSLEKTVDVTSNDADETDDQKRAYECINDQDIHIYAEVTRKVSTEVTSANHDQNETENIDNQNDSSDDDDDYQNIREKDVTVGLSIEKTVVTTTSVHQENVNGDDDDDNNDDGDDESKRVTSESDVKSISVTLTVEKKDKESSIEINEEGHRDYNTDQEKCVNQSEVIVHKVPDDNDDGNDDDDKIAINCDNATEVTITATASTFSADASNLTRSNLYENSAEENESRTVSVTIVKTETTHHQNEEEDGYLVPVLGREFSRENAESLSSLGDSDSIKSGKGELIEKEIVKVEKEKKEEFEESRNEIKENFGKKNENSKETVSVSLVIEKDGNESIQSQHSVATKPTSLPQSVELTAQSDQRNEIKSPTGIKSPSTSGSFVLRNARNKDAMHFMQHIRSMANGQPTDLEKGEILTILRSTSIEDKVASSKPSNRHSIVTTDVFKQFETASSGTGGVFPQSRTTRSISVIEAKQPTVNGDVTISKTTVSKTTAADVGKGATVEVKTTAATVIKNDTDRISNNSKELKSSEMLAKQLELKLKAKEQQKQEEQERRTTTTVVITNDIDTLVRPSTLSRQMNTRDGTTASAQSSSRVPQWQLDLKERNRSKRSTSGSVTPASPNNGEAVTSPQSPPWLVDLQAKNIKVKSINGEVSNKN